MKFVIVDNWVYIVIVVFTHNASQTISQDLVHFMWKALYNLFYERKGIVTDVEVWKCPKFSIKDFLQGNLFKSMEGKCKCTIRRSTIV